MPPEDDDPPGPPKRRPPPPLRPEVRAFLSRKDVSQWVHDRVRKKVSKRHAQEVAQDVLTEAASYVVWPDSDEEKSSGARS